jgi:hypothetical protein
MASEWINFIDVLHERGRKCGYKTDANKQSDKLTLMEQVEMSAHLLKTICDIEAVRALTYKIDHISLANKIISNEGIDSHISASIVEYFYATIDEMLYERNNTNEYIPPTPLSERIVYLGE